MALVVSPVRALPGVGGVEFFLDGMQFVRGFYYRVAHMSFYNFYFNEVYNFMALNNVSYYFTQVFLNTDKGLLELVGPLGFSRFYRALTQGLVRYYRVTVTAQFYNFYHFFLFYFFV